VYRPKKYAWVELLQATAPKVLRYATTSAVLI